MFAGGFGVFEDIVVPEADDFVALGVEPGGAAGVVGNLVGVLAAVDFDDQAAFVAEEVDDVGADGGLPADLVAVELPGAKDGPEGALGGGGVAAESAGAGR